MSRGAKDGVQLQNRLRKSNKCAIIIISSDGCNTTGKVGSERVEGRYRGQSTEKKTNADFDIEPKAGRLQLRKTDPPSGNEVWYTTGGAGRIVKGVQKFSTVCKVACTVILSQSLVDRKSRAIGDSRGR